ncbi:hypothetical protein [Ruminiclostridium josui]|uniref:hypothetical protein n=1 Tax=Ruminiclostridium josui TaxID=1499 RepID=UPI0004641026|nr:hypothetical protein [Ruminiclostridium josui]
MLYSYNSGSFPNDMGNIVASAYGDVNGDGIADYVYLTAVKAPDGYYLRDITLVIKDGRTGIKQSAKLPSNAGYSPGLFLGDFTGDRINDILIGINSGGSGAIMFYYVFSDVNNRLSMIFNYEDFNNEYQYKVNYLNYYKVSVQNQTDKYTYILDITYKGGEYLSEIYTNEGILKAPIEGWVDPLSGLYPVDFDGDGIYELLGYQKIAGRYHADSLGFVQSILEFKNMKFELSSQYVAIFGSRG